MKKVALIGAFGLTLAACATTNNDVIVTVPFDPSSYDRVAVYTSAQAQCKAKGFRTASPAAEQPTNTSGAFGHQAFVCERF